MISEIEARKIIHGTAVALTVNPMVPQGSLSSIPVLTIEAIFMVTLVVKKCDANWTQTVIKSFVDKQLKQNVEIIYRERKNWQKYLPPCLIPNMTAKEAVCIIEAIGWTTYEACRTQLAQNQ